MVLQTPSGGERRTSDGVRPPDGVCNPVRNVSSSVTANLQKTKHSNGVANPVGHRTRTPPGDGETVK